MLPHNHVVAEAEKIEIVLKDGQVYQATLVGRDPKTDLALLKVQAAGLTVTAINDTTPIPHNGCRPPKRRRV